MKQVDGMLLVILVILAGVAFLNFGSLSVSSTTSGVGFGAGFTRPPGR
jgi:hypothetical protein